MGIVVKLPARRQGRPASATDADSAAILFFTGVRYERDRDAVQDVPEGGDRPSDRDELMAVECAQHACASSVLLLA